VLFRSERSGCVGSCLEGCPISAKRGVSVTRRIVSVSGTFALSLLFTGCPLTDGYYVDPALGASGGSASASGTEAADASRGGRSTEVTSASGSSRDTRIRFTDGTASSGGAESTTGADGGSSNASSSVGACETCSLAVCSTDHQDCATDPPCASAMTGFFACLDTATSTGDPMDVVRCDTDFVRAAASRAADALATCVHGEGCSNVCQ
jgi:hypothetical protein